MMKNLLLGLLLFNSIQLLAQSQTRVDTNAVKTIDGIVNETLKIISGEQGKERDWEFFRQLFLPEAQFSVLHHLKDGTRKIKTLTVQEFVDLVEKSSQNNSFIELEIGKVMDEYNGIAQVFQSYYAKQNTTEERGINSIQLVNDGIRWWIVSILWTSDRNGVKIPKKYLKK